jgi:hypothetical protein
MAGVTYRQNRAGIRAMTAAPFMVKAMGHVGEVVRIEAERIAPVDTGAYAFGTPNDKGATGGGFVVTSGVKDGHAYARVTNSVRSAPSRNWPDGYGYGWALEFGNSRTRKQRILGRALDAAALHLA